MDVEKSDIYPIGAGSFATVYVWHSWAHVAFKIVRNPSLSEELQEEFEDLQLLYRVFAASHNALFKVPRPMGYYSLAEFKAKTAMNSVNAEGLKDHLDDSGLFTMERIWPVPSILARFICQQFFPEHYKDFKPFVCRIYLGRKNVEKQLDFWDFPLDADKLSKLKISTTVDRIAHQMGQCLATIHFQTKRDARGVEFILGGKNLYTPSFFCIDFNQMHQWEDPSELVESFYANDSYYPQPGTDYWEIFQAGYMNGAGTQIKMATEVLELIVKRSDSASFLLRS